MTASTAPVKLTAEDLSAALRRRLESQGGWYQFEEVQAGPSAGRFADVVAVQTFWSRGIKVEAYELKVNRGDWLKELRDPEKAEAIAKHVDRFYVVASPGVVQLAEVPEGWGLLECRPPSNKLRQLKAAPPLQDGKRKRVSLGMFIGILRAAERAWWKPTSADFERVAQQARLEGYDAGKRAAGDKEPADLQLELDRLRKTIREFNEKSGVQLHEYNGGDLGAAMQVLRLLESGRGWSLRARAEYAEHSLAQALADLRVAMRELDAAAKVPA